LVRYADLVLSVRIAHFDQKTSTAGGAQTRALRADAITSWQEFALCTPAPEMLRGLAEAKSARPQS
jgi:hypothetical protein